MLASLLLVAAALWVLEGATAASEAPQATRKHIVMIVIDDLRPEMTPYMHDYMHTPNFQRLADKSMVFDDAYCQQAVCSPSRNSFMSGRRPDKTHVFNFVQTFRDDGIGNRWTTFPGLFKQRGWRVVGAGKTYHPNLPPNYDGSNSWSNFSNQLPYFNPLMLDCKNYTDHKLKRCAVPEDGEMSDYLSIQHAMGLLNESVALNDKNTMAWFGLHKPHLPWRRPKNFDSFYPPAEQTDLAKHRTIPENAPLIAWHDTGDNVNPWTPHNDTDEREARHAYRATISFCDSMVGRILDGIDALGIANNTAIFLWADHGWQLSEHGEWRKMTVFELATRVPLMIHVPWMPQSQGKRTSALAELVDMMPTAAELMGVELMQNETIDGTSLVPVLNDPTATVKDAAFSQYPRCPKNVSIPWKSNACLQVSDNSTQMYAMGYSMRVKDWRYTEWIKWDGASTDPDWSTVLGTELYDHTGDAIESDFNAYENANLHGQAKYATLEAQLKAQLRKHFKGDGCERYKTCE